MHGINLTRKTRTPVMKLPTWKSECGISYTNYTLTYAVNVTYLFGVSFMIIAFISTSTCTNSFAYLGISWMQLDMILPTSCLLQNYKCMESIGQNTKQEKVLPSVLHVHGNDRWFRLCRWLLLLTWINFIISMDNTQYNVLSIIHADSIIILPCSCSSWVK